MSQNTRRLRLGTKDVNEYVERFKTECGEIVSKQLSKEELEKLLNDMKKSKIRRN